MRGLRVGPVAVLRHVPVGARRPVAAVVRAVLRTVFSSDGYLPRLPTRPDRDRPGAVRVRRAGPPGGPSAEVRRVASRRGRAGGGDGRGVVRRHLGAERGHVGPAFQGPARRPRVRPGEGARPRGRAQARCAGLPPHPSRGRSRAAGSPGGRLASRGDAGDVRGCRVDPAGCCSWTTCSRPAPPAVRAHRRCSLPGPRRWGSSPLPVPRPRPGDPRLYSATGSRPGLWLPRGTDPRQSMPAAGEATHVSRPLVGEHGAV